jgi:pyridoxine 5-phosphate synthase
MIYLGVNVDHVATVRQSRRTTYPDVVEAALAAERGGADGITVHLREDRRHIQDRDVEGLLRAVSTKVNLEMAVTEEMVQLAERWRPKDACMVPERREELTTEGGLDVAGNFEDVRTAVQRLRAAGIRVSLFIDPVKLQIEASSQTGANAVELHTGRYADAESPAAVKSELARIAAAATHAAAHRLIVNAGHGLRLDNVAPIAALAPIHELNIGHSIVARAIFVGIEQATREMKERMLAARKG